MGGHELRQWPGRWRELQADTIKYFDKQSEQIAVREEGLAQLSHRGKKEETGWAYMVAQGKARPGQPEVKSRKLNGPSDPQHTKATMRKTMEGWNTDEEKAGRIREETVQRRKDLERRKDMEDWKT